MKATVLILGTLGLFFFTSCTECEIEEEETIRTENSNESSERSKNDTIKIR